MYTHEMPVRDPNTDWWCGCGFLYSPLKSVVIIIQIRYTHTHSALPYSFCLCCSCFKGVQTAGSYRSSNGARRKKILNIHVYIIICIWQIPTTFAPISVPHSSSFQYHFFSFVPFTLLFYLLDIYLKEQCTRFIPFVSTQQIYFIKRQLCLNQLKKIVV